VWSAGGGGGGGGGPPPPPAAAHTWTRHTMVSIMCGVIQAMRMAMKGDLYAT
jgi:hypothetical protein